MENLYAVLGVRNEATLAEIKKAYREKVKNLHPDSTGKSADNEEFSRVVHAYRVLSDSHQRSIFDDSYFIKIRREKKSYDSFDYYKWLSERQDEESRAKLIFFCLMQQREDEAVKEYKRMKMSHLNFSLKKWFTREDFMDYGYILCEELVIRGEYYDAILLLEEIINMERSYQYFRLFFPEVMTFTLNILKRNIEGYMNDELALDVWERALDLGFSNKDDAFFLKKMAGIYSKLGDEATARICFEEANKLI